MLHLKRPCTQFLILISSARRIQEENISISHQALMYAREGMVTTFPSRITIPRQVQVNLSANLHYYIKNNSFSKRLDREAIECHVP